MPPNGAALDRELAPRPRGHGNALGEGDHDAEVVARDEAELVEGAVLLSGGGSGLGLGVVKEAGGGAVEGARFAEDVAGVDGAEFFLGVAAARGGVGEDGAEGEAGERVAVLGRGGCGGAEGRQDFTEGCVSPGEVIDGRDVECTLEKVGRGWSMKK